MRDSSKSADPQSDEHSNMSEDVASGGSRDRRPAADKSDDVLSLYKEHAAPLVAGMRKMFGPGPPDPEDVAQQAFQKLLERGDLESISNVRAFIWRTARNIIIDDRRSRDTRDKYDFEVEQIFFPLKDDVLTPEHVLVAKEQLEAVKTVLRNMPERRRRALILHRVEGLSIVEVGRRLGIARPSASAHVARAMADLSTIFIDREDGLST
ncbi:MAG: sigma-70 family RNA polymerase sigma factor [Pseudomonadota bacterium]